MINFNKYIDLHKSLANEKFISEAKRISKKLNSIWIIEI